MVRLVIWDAIAPIMTSLYCDLKIRYQLMEFTETQSSEYCNNMIGMRGYQDSSPIYGHQGLF